MKLKKLLYIFQLEGYEVDRFRKWLGENKETEIVESKQKIKWTIKAKALYLLSFFSNLLTLGKLTSQTIIFSYQLLLLAERLTKYIIILGAKCKISKRKDLIIIGITGSYGKTSVKEILAHILSAKYIVLKTPDSYNTPLGISKIINQKLRREHQVFVVEMGAHQKGDIKALCDLVKPQVGIITSIGKQHLERFGNEENIEDAKFEILDCLPVNGKAFLNINDPKIFNKAKKYPQDKINYFGICENCVLCESDFLNKCNSALKVADIKMTSQGTVFSIITEKGEVRNITTPLLGKHNVRNIMAGVNVARYLDIPYEEIERKCLTLEPIPHRLHLIKGANETTIIDDAFNANPDSARAALEVLSDFPAVRKIIITPGLVELGKKQKEENRIFGQEMAEIADYVVVVGETNRKAILTGLSSIQHPTRFDRKDRRASNIQQIAVKNLNEAMERLKEIVVPGSLILFENDLPDQYR